MKNLIILIAILIVLFIVVVLMFGNPNTVGGLSLTQEIEPAIPVLEEPVLNSSIQETYNPQQAAGVNHAN